MLYSPCWFYYSCQVPFCCPSTWLVNRRCVDSPAFAVVKSLPKPAVPSQELTEPSGLRSSLIEVSTHVVGGCLRCGIPTAASGLNFEQPTVRCFSNFVILKELFAYGEYVQYLRTIIVRNAIKILSIMLFIPGSRVAGGVSDRAGCRVPTADCLQKRNFYFLLCPCPSPLVN